MRFGPVAIAASQGGILAHSIKVGKNTFRKGRVLNAEDIATLSSHGVCQVTLAQLAADDMGEDAAATALGDALLAPGLRQSEAFTGRVNLIAQDAGILRVNRERVDAVNSVDEKITLACLPDYARLEKGTLVATVKIIPYGVEKAKVDAALAAPSAPVFSTHPFAVKTADLVLTRTQGFKPSLLNKGEAAVRTRMNALGVTLGQVITVTHDEAELADALGQTGSELVLVLGASATSDRMDVAPQAVVRAGGRIERFGMPVDPGNLLFLGRLQDRQVVGLPGCARALALNGADWVLERLVAHLPLSGEDIALMGVGGLLKEIPQRAQPRRQRAQPNPRTRVEVILLAAGSSRRMQGEDKLLKRVNGVPLLRRSAQAMLDSNAAKVHVVLPLDADARKTALAGLPLSSFSAPEADLGMAHSLRFAMGQIGEDCAAVIIALADMPDVGPKVINQLIDAYDPAENRSICCPVTPEGKRGNPVLFDRRFFENLAQLSGDRGARDLLKDMPEFVAEVAIRGSGILVDLDTPEAWEQWLQSRQ